MNCEVISEGKDRDRRKDRQHEDALSSRPMQQATGLILLEYLGGISEVSTQKMKGRGIYLSLRFPLIRDGHTVRLHWYVVS